MKQAKLIYDVSCEYFGLDLMSRSRKKEYVIARQFLYAILRDYSVMHVTSTLQEIGRLVGRDHATIIHNLREFNYEHNEESYNEYRNYIVEKLNINREQNLKSINNKAVDDLYRKVEKYRVEAKANSILHKESERKKEAAFELLRRSLAYLDSDKQAGLIYDINNLI